jgi:D-beta-D-heptose 7-phosphate kinase/D-beta-D-heptose 1-phosphate adenosyltransferase|tara:strand:+ start:740 stop:1513 length:774 start_codon:yes stop_codon:yes gene_type:complete
MKKLVLVTGGFDPIHDGHISYFVEAKKLGDKLIVGINSDEWLRRKKGKEFQSLEIRTTIIQHLDMVSECIHFDDSDGTAKDAIQVLLEKYPEDEIVFANGGDRTDETTPEHKSFALKDRLTFAYGVGEEKKYGSRDFLASWVNQQTEKSWGHYKVLYRDDNVKVKEIVIRPGETLSYQRHNLRSEIWFVTKGVLANNTEHPADRRLLKTETFNKHEFTNITVGTWHQLNNPSNEDVKLIEIQYGDKCTEEDIEHKNE